MNLSSNCARVLIAAFLVTATASCGLLGWKAPSEAARVVNPIPTSVDSIQLGREAYKQTCAACHGSAGAGDGFATAMLKRKPKNLSQVLPGQSDGELFWKIRNGNAFMPSSADALSEEQTWHVINFLRTFQAASESRSS